MTIQRFSKTCAWLSIGFSGLVACAGAQPSDDDEARADGATCGTSALDDASSSGGAPLGTGGSIEATGGNSAGGSASGGSGEPQLIPAQLARQKIIDFFGEISGNFTLAGIENKSSSAPHAHTDEIAGLAGRTPSFWGADFGFGSGAVNQRSAMIAEAKKQWSDGAVVALMYHTCVPTRDELCGWDDIGGAHPVHLSNQQWDDLFTPGTAIYVEWHRRLDILAGFFQELRDAGVAPIFRPFHEVNQCAFWWSCVNRANGSVRLWKDTYDYLVHEKGQDHVVWAWNIQDFTSLASDVVTYSPGADYFDLATLDIYNTGYTSGNYNTMLGMAGGKPIGVGECQFLPSIELLNNQPQWTFFMLWPDFIYEAKNTPLYKPLFQSQRVMTLDEMPGWD